MTKPVSARVFVVFAMVAILLAISGSAAWAGGDATLDALIVKNPVPGWTPLDPALVRQSVSLEQRAVSSILNEPVQVAVEGWNQGPYRLLVVVIKLPQTIARPDVESRQAVLSACTSATGNPALSVGTYAGISGAAEASCGGVAATAAQIPTTAISWARGNLFTLIVAGGLAQSRVETVATSQDAALPAAGLSAGALKPNAGSDTWSTVAVAVGVGALVLLVSSAGIAGRLRRLHDPLEPPAPAAPTF